MKISILKRILLIASIIISITSYSKTNLIKPSNKNILYLGRVEHPNKKEVRFDLPGVTIKTKFKGTSCKMLLNDNGNRYNIYLNNQAPFVITTDKNKTEYIIAKNLADTIHNLKIVKITEAIFDIVTFKGFILDKRCKLLKPEYNYSKKIEFIGNSITCGYGVEGDSPNCKFSATTENIEKSFAGLMAKYFNADYRTFAYSGYGIIRNYGEKSKKSAKPLPYFYDRTCWNDENSVYDFDQWTPDLVVIKLGNNDCSTDPTPNKDDFVEAYQDLISRIQEHHPDAQIVCIAGPLTRDPAYDYIKSAVKELQLTGVNNLAYIEICPEIIDITKDYGCDFHPNENAQIKIKNILIPTIEGIMHW